MNPIDSSDLDVPLEPFPLPEHHDTDRSPHPPEEEMPKPDRSQMTDRELLLAVHERLDEGDDRFAKIEEQHRQHIERYERNDAINLRFMHTINMSAGQLRQARENEDELNKRYPANGVDHDTPTNPENAHPEPDA